MSDLGRFERIGLAIDASMVRVRVFVLGKWTRFRYWMRGERLPTREEIVRETLRNRREEVAQNIEYSNALIRRMRRNHE